MPNELFTLAPSSRTARTKRGWTLFGSLVLHGAFFVALVSISLSSALDGPKLLQQIDRYVIAAATPPEPPPPPASAPAEKQKEPIDPDIAPAVAPTGVTPEPDLPPSTGAEIPHGFGVSSLGVPRGVGPIATLSAAPPAAPVPEIRRVGGDIREPQRLVYVQPMYPAIALAAKAEGIVKLEATLDETGAVRDVKVVQSHPLFDRAATEAVSRWRYSPTRLNGTPVPVILTITVRFALR